MKNTFSRKFTVCALAGVLGFALSACDDSSSAGGDGGETSVVESSSSTTVNKDKSSESKTEDEISSGEDQSVNEGKTQSSDNRGGLNKTSSSSKGNNGGLLSSSSVGGVGLCSYGTCDVEDEIVRISGYGITNFICKNGCYEEIVVESSSSSSSKYPVMDSVFNSELSYGEFEDPRDHQIYKTRTLTLSNGQKIEVFAQNLNYGKFLKEGDEIIEGDTIKFCYDDDEWYCDNFYGGQYTWAGVMGFPYACNDHKTNTVECPFILDADDYGRQYRGICPEGWHITNKREWAVGIVGGRGSLSVSKASGGVDAAGLSILLRNNYASWFLPSVLDGNLQENDTHAQVLKFSIETGEFGYVRKGAEITGKYVPDSKHRSIVGVRCTRDYVYEN